MQPRQQATLTQPLQCVCKHWIAKHNRTTRNGVGNCSSKTGSRRQSEKKRFWSTVFKGILKGKLLAPTTRCRTQRRNQFAHETTAAATAAHTRYLSSPAEATLHRKTQSFVLQLPPQNKAHATVMQPLQCIWQHHVANPHVSTHMATEHDNNHAAIPMPSATRDSRDT